MSSRAQRGTCYCLLLREVSMSPASSAHAKDMSARTKSRSLAALGTTSHTGRHHARDDISNGPTSRARQHPEGLSASSGKPLSPLRGARASSAAILDRNSRAEQSGRPAGQTSRADQPSRPTVQTRLADPAGRPGGQACRSDATTTSMSSRAERGTCYRLLLREVSMSPASSAYAKDMSAQSKSRSLAALGTTSHTGRHHDWDDITHGTTSRLGRHHARDDISDGPTSRGRQHHDQDDIKIKTSSR